MWHKYSTAKKSSDRKVGNSILLDNAVQDNSTATYLDMTPPGDVGTKWTISFWMKGGFQNITSGGGGRIINVGASATNPGGAIGGTYIMINPDGTLGCGNDNRVDDGISLLSTMIFRDAGAWYHIICRYDSTLANEAERMRIYVNGRTIPLTPYNSAYWPSLNQTTWMFSNRQHRIGTSNDASWSYCYDGMLAEFYGISNESYGPEYFAELTNNGEYIPKEFTGEYGNSGFYLAFNEPDKLGLDSSGNGRDWIGTRLAAPECWTDYPTNNFPTMEPHWKSRGSDRTYCLRDFSAGNTMVDILRNSNGYFNQASNMLFPNYGKWYFEFNKTRVMADNPDYWTFGVGDPNQVFSNHAPYATTAPCIYATYTSAANNLGLYWGNKSDVTTFNHSPVNEWFGMGIDWDNNQCSVWYGGSKILSVDISDWVGDMALLFGRGGGDAGWNADANRVNFGQYSEYAGSNFQLPDGFNTISTLNFKDPTVDTATNFVTQTYTGNGSEQEITTSVDADLVWIKNRPVAYNHLLFDTIREAGRYIAIDDVYAQVTDSSTLRYFNNNGFTVGDNVVVNGLNQEFVSYNFKGGDSNETNNDGTIPSIVSANKEMGFSIVRYDGTGNNGTVGHGLGKPPTMCLFLRNYQDMSSNYHMNSNLPDWTYSLVMDDNNTPFQSAGTMTGPPDSSVINLGNFTGTNAAGRDHIIYCFTDSEMVKTGYYMGNGSPDGIALGMEFSPQWLLIKNLDSRTNWNLTDSGRDPTNIVQKYFESNTAGVEQTYDTVNYYSNGIQLKTAGGQVNSAGVKYIYLAIGHKVLKQARGR